MWDSNNNSKNEFTAINVYLMKQTNKKYQSTLHLNELKQNEKEAWSW